MEWIQPSSKTPHLSLPKLQKTSPINFAFIDAQDSDLSVSVDKNFLDVWSRGPENESAKEISRCIEILSHPCCDLIKLGRGAVDVKIKTSHSDLVTNMDTGIEMIFRVWINRFLPEHKIIGEEGFKDHISSQDAVWYIDPVDGTSNFVDGRDEVSLHINCVKNGKPFCATVGLPFKNRLVSGYIGQDNVSLESKKSSDQITIGTEYRDNDIETNLFNQVLDYFNAKSYRVKSMGCNLMACLSGEVDVFYKPGVRYWDIMAPLSLIYFLRDDVEMKIYIPDSEGRLIQDGAVSLSPFSNQKELVDRINYKNQSNCRIGFIVVFPKGRDDIVDLILKNYFTVLEKEN